VTLKRVASGSGHRYELDGQRVAGVTTIINGGLPKPALIEWAARCSADLVTDAWDDLATMTPSARHKAVLGARWTVNRAATTRGRDIHAVGEALARGQTVDVPEALIGPAESYARWLDANAVVAWCVETPCASRRWLYAGTLDLIAVIAGETWLLDIKTGANLYAENALQLAAYAHCDLIVVDGAEEPFPAVDQVGIVHVLPDTCELRPVDAGDETHRVFLYVKQVHEWITRAKDASPIGEAVRTTVEPMNRYRLEVVPA